MKKILPSDSSMQSSVGCWNNTAPLVLVGVLPLVFPSLRAACLRLRMTFNGSLLGQWQVYDFERAWPGDSDLRSFWPGHDDLWSYGPGRSPFGSNQPSCTNFRQARLLNVYESHCIKLTRGLYGVQRHAILLHFLLGNGSSKGLLNLRRPALVALRNK